MKNASKPSCPSVRLCSKGEENERQEKYIKLSYERGNKRSGVTSQSKPSSEVQLRNERAVSIQRIPCISDELSSKYYDIAVYTSMVRENTASNKNYSE